MKQLTKTLKIVSPFGGIILQGEDSIYVYESKRKNILNPNNKWFRAKLIGDYQKIVGIRFNGWIPKWKKVIQRDVVIMDYVGERDERLKERFVEEGGD